MDYIILFSYYYSLKNPLGALTLLNTTLSVVANDN
nr:MAG TPA: hypothetical protein [Caudoviricetes sp.]